MSQPLAPTAQRHQAAPLPSSNPNFRALDSLILQIEAQPRYLRRAMLRLRKRWIERAVPAYSQGGRT